MGNLTMEYDLKGNITYQPYVGAMKYTDPNRPYALTSLATCQAGDMNGWENYRRNQVVNYNGMMRPQSISENGRTNLFTYNNAGDRVKMEKKEGHISQLQRYYLGGVYEIDQTIDNTAERLYLGGDAYSAPAVYVRQGTGAWQVQYIGRDYLGSITHVTDATGTVKQELSYDPWGRLRNPVTQALYDIDTRLNLILGDRGYTGHEHLTEYGLINMNARLYDPVVGRFLSPDPYVQAPFMSQNFNRYSYALNNPLRYTDPNGEFIHIIIGAAIGGVANWALNGFQFNAKGLASFGIGALAGGLGAATGGLISGVGFIAGATSGAVSGFTSGAVLGAGNAWASGASLNAGFSAGLKGGLLGAATGALVSGVASGINSARNGGNFFTGKGYSKVSELAAVGQDTDLGGDGHLNRSNLKSIQEELGWKPGKLGVDNMSIDGQIISKDPDFAYFRNDHNGIIEKSIFGEKAYRVRGLTYRYYKNIFQTQTDMYFSFHKSLLGLKITVNHELIHAYHSVLGFRPGSEYSEYSATYNTAKYMPQYNMDLLQMTKYSSAFLLGYGWPNYLLPIK